MGLGLGLWSGLALMFAPLAIVHKYVRWSLRLLGLGLGIGFRARARVRVRVRVKPRLGVRARARVGARVGVRGWAHSCASVQSVLSIFVSAPG